MSVPRPTRMTGVVAARASVEREREYLTYR
jgi:hypothetical protein